MTRARLLSLLGLLCVALGATAAVALAATRNGVTPISPRAGAEVPQGRAPTFVVRARGGGEVYVRVCRSRATRADGLICAAESVGRAKRGANGRYRYKPRVYDYPGFWLNRPGTYHWQAHRIRCEQRRTRDCRQEGPVQSLEVMR